MTDAARLFDEFAAAHRRGDAPDVSAFLDRAGDARGDLAVLIDAFLASVPAQPASGSDLAFLRARLGGEAGLLVRRQERRLTLRELAAALRERLGLPAGSEARLERRYHELESGRLDPARVAAQLWDALDAVLGASARMLATAAPAPTAARQPAFRRARLAEVLDRAIRAPGAAAPPSDAAAAAAPAAAAASPDADVDRLFGVG